MPQQALHQPEVAVGILMIAEQGADHAAGGTVHRDQEGGLGTVIAQPPVIAAVQLDQHTLPRHPLPAHPVLRWAPSPRTFQSGVDQDAPRGGPADDDALTFGKQLTEMRVVGAFVPGASQVDHIGQHGIGCGVGRSTAAVTMGEGSRASLLIGRQDAPGVARADSHQFSRLIQGNVLGEEAVQNLKSGLFFRGQSHIHPMVNVTFLLNT